MSQYKNDIFYYASQLPAPNTPEPNQNSQIYTATPTPRLDEGIHSSSRKRKPKRTEEEKLEHMLGVLNKLTWTLSEFLYMLFRVKDDQGQKVTRNQKHVGIVSCFLGGATKYTVGQVLEAWLCDSSRKPHHNSAKHSAMFSPIALYSHQKHAHVAITAAQLVLKELERRFKWSLGATRLAQQTSARVIELGQSDILAGVMRFDNVQRWLKQHELCIGRESQMKVGMAVTVAEIVDFNAAAFDLDDKLAREVKNKQKDLTVDKLLDMIDMDHLECLHKYKLYRTDEAKMHLPVRHTVVHPLATVAKKETVTVELRDGLLDFLGQMGIQDDSFQWRIIFIGGNGMSFKKMLNLKYYSQFQLNELRQLTIVEPFLELWHTIWTNLSSIYETHWGETLTKDPSRFGHSANKIGQKTPANLKKVDYYPACHLAYLVLDARMLDCWRIYFNVDNLLAHFDLL
ncbi:hypothetical protein PHLCEN_2v5683 [Hermanssonia centrifuga]|uniref:DUF6589 domain-containing protein n=1 Tax=Hermanssonia centrifuga TaxID=98765 RepID=A0A2R6P1P9_9APHY|nr:hypothetical protein PHLCEN_2v5683 [Hermanssonia centrifuga]